ELLAEGDTEQAEAGESTAEDQEKTEEEGGPDPYTEEELGLIDEPPTVTEEEPESDETKKEDEQKEGEQAEQPEEDRSREEKTEESPEQAEEPADQAEEAVDADETADEGDDTSDEEELEIFYTIQAASSKKRENAERAREEYRGMGHSAAVREASINDQKWYRVRVGEFPTRRDARQYAEQMVEDGELNDYWISQVERE
ncbi:MAG: SPOR domain-containing protein, partial [bacterium]